MPYNDTDFLILVTFSEEMIFGFIEDNDTDFLILVTFSEEMIFGFIEEIYIKIRFISQSR